MGFRSVIPAYRHMKIKNKLSILITLIIALSLAFTIITQQYVFSVYDGQIYEKSSRVLNLSSTAIESELKRVQQLSYRILAEEQVQDWLTALKKNPSDYDRLITSQYLVDRLISYSGVEPYLYSIQIMDASGNEHEVGNLLKQDSDRKQQIKDVAAKGMGENRWIYPDDKDPALIVTREIRSFHKTNFDLDYLGTLVIRINIDKIVRDIAPEEGDVMIVSEGNVIFPSSPSIDLSLLAKPINAVQGYEIQHIGKEEYFIAQTRSSQTGWTYLNVTPFNQIFDRILFIKEMVVFVFIAIFIVVIVLGIRFSYGLTRPIDELMIRMKLAEKGNFEEANLFPSGGQVAMNEIGLLQRSFRFMIERINTLIQENYANRLLLKETEFKALQSQINPHFLYNTLESINWMAKVNRQAKISEMVEALAYLLRHSIDLKEPIIPLIEEIDIVRSYVTIQKIRFEERLVFNLDVPDALLTRSIPKLTLQPLMENAIHYALEQAIDPCEITIRGWSTEEGDFLVVEDTGPGMPSGLMERLRSGEVTTKGKGIGLLNIDDRMKLAFGEAYGIRVDEEAEHGARIILSLPKGMEE